METKWKFIWVGVVVIALIFAGFLWYQNFVQKAQKAKLLSQNTATEETTSTEENLADVIEGEDFAEQGEEADYNAICENGEWVRIADQSGDLSTVSGKLRKVYPDETASEFKNYLFYIEGTENFGITGKDLFRLDYFEDREVEVEGVKNNEKKEIAVSQVRCTGKETDKNLLEERKKLMGYLATNINTLAPQKAKYQKWVVDIVDFVDEHNVYVEYYDAIEDDEESDVDEDTSRKILVEASTSPAGTYSAKILAYWEIGEDDYILKTGADKFEDAETIASYQYDSESKTWERID